MGPRAVFPALSPAFPTKKHRSWKCKVCLNPNSLARECSVCDHPRTISGPRFCFRGLPSTNSSSEVTVTPAVNYSEIPALSLETSFTKSVDDKSVQDFEIAALTKAFSRLSVTENLGLPSCRQLVPAPLQFSSSPFELKKSTLHFSEAMEVDVEPTVDHDEPMDIEYSIPGPALMPVSLTRLARKRPLSHFTGVDECLNGAPPRKRLCARRQVFTETILILSAQKTIAKLHSFQTFQLPVIRDSISYELQERSKSIKLSLDFDSDKITNLKCIESSSLISVKIQF